MRDLKGKVAAITGAASGIGRALAVNLSKQGCHVAISDIDATGLGQTADMLKHHPVNVTTHVVDVARQDQVARYAAEVVRYHGGVHLLINNAGLWSPKPWRT